MGLQGHLERDKEESGAYSAPGLHHGTTAGAAATAAAGASAAAVAVAAATAATAAAAGTSVDAHSAISGLQGKVYKDACSFSRHQLAQAILPVEQLKQVMQSMRTAWLLPCQETWTVLADVQAFALAASCELQSKKVLESVQVRR